MKTIIRCSLIAFSFALSLILNACGNVDALSARNFNSSWTPQYAQISQYFAMGNTTFTNTATFKAEVGTFGTVSNADGIGMNTTPGIVGNAVQFAGGDDRISVPLISGNNSANFSISLWVKRNSQAGRGCMVTSRDESPARGYSFCINASEQPEIQIGQGGSAGNWTTVTGSTILLNSWTHLVATYDGTNLRLYKNGVLEASPVSAFVANSARPLYIGAGGTELTPSASDAFNGMIDEVGIWSSVLSADDVKTIYNKQVL